MALNVLGILAALILAGWCLRRSDRNWAAAERILGEGR